MLSVALQGRGGEGRGGKGREGKVGSLVVVVAAQGQMSRRRRQATNEVMGPNPQVMGGRVRKVLGPQII